MRKRKRNSKYAKTVKLMAAFNQRQTKQKHSFLIKSKKSSRMNRFEFIQRKLQCVQNCVNGPLNSYVFH